jgi:putative flippase GtrA
VSHVALRRQLVRFLLVGGLAALANFGSRWIFSRVMSYELAVVLAYLVGMAISYTIFRFFVFENSGRSVTHEVTWFVAVNAVALVQVWLVSVGLYRYGLPALGWSWRPDLVAHAIGIASPMVTSYFGHKHVSFRKKRHSPSVCS